MLPTLFFTGIPFLALAATSGTTWSSAGIWDDGNDRTLYPEEHDTTGTQLTGEGRARITGDGRLVLVGDAPRYRVLEPTFDNVSITVYAMRIAEEEELAYQGFVIGARSQHYTDAECGANTYYASITYDGFARFEKELFHGAGDNAFYPSINENDDVPLPFDGPIPREVWIGLNFTITTTEEGNARLQLAIDKADGEGFRPVLDYTDNGDWPIDSDGEVECEGFYPENKIIQSPGMTFIRNDGLGQAEYKDLVIRELPG